jgi:hypothetical protein
MLPHTTLALRPGREHADYGTQRTMSVLFPDHGAHSELSRKPDWPGFHSRRLKAFGAIRRPDCLEWRA